MKTFMKKLITLITSAMMILSTVSMQSVFAKPMKNVVRKVTMSVKQKKTVTIKKVKKVTVSPKTKVKVSPLKKKGKKIKGKYVILAKKAGLAKVTFTAGKRYIYKITIKAPKITLSKKNKPAKQTADPKVTTQKRDDSDDASIDNGNESVEYIDYSGKKDESKDVEKTTSKPAASTKTKSSNTAKNTQTNKPATSTTQTDKPATSTTQTTNTSNNQSTINGEEYRKKLLKESYQEKIDTYQKEIDNAKKYRDLEQAKKDENLSKLKAAQEEDDKVVAKINAVDQEISDLQEKLKKAQATYDQSKPLLAKGSIYFFEKMGAKNAVKYFSTPIGVFKNLDLSKYENNDYYASDDVLAGKYEVENMLNYTDMGADGDATSIVNMRKAINFLKEQNQLRASEGKAPYKVSLLGLANAQAEANYAYQTFDHPVFYTEVQFSGFGYKPKLPGTIGGSGENLAWYYKDPFDGWYTQEKKTAELYAKKERGETLTKEEKDYIDADGITGHYYNVVSDRYDVSSIGFKTKGAISIATYDKAADLQNKKYYFHDDHKIMTVEELESSFNDIYGDALKAYDEITSIDKKIDELNEKKKDLNYDRKKGEVDNYKLYIKYNDESIAGNNEVIDFNTKKRDEWQAKYDALG